MTRQTMLTARQCSVPSTKLRAVLTVLRKVLGSGKSNTPPPDSPHCGAAPQLNPIQGATTEDGEPYSVEGLLPLETIIPYELMPDELIVHDPFNLTRCLHPPIRHTVRYGRAMPLVVKSARSVNPARELAEGVSHPRVAHLYLQPRSCLGEGSHSRVFRAPLQLRLDSGSDLLTRVTVAVKTAARDCVSHGMLHQEAMMYTAFPRTLMEDASPKEPPSAAANDASATAPPAGDRQLGCDGHYRHNRQASHAVVPKFYGYYLPLDDDENLMWSTHPECTTVRRGLA